MDARILNLIEQTDAIPSAPQLVTRLLELTANPNYQQGDVANLLAVDPGVAADVLRMANSAFFGLARKVSDLRQALSLLGIQRVKTLVLGRCMAERLNAQRTRLIDTSYYWRRSIASAVLAGRLGELLKHPRESAFMAGLLSDIGVVILCRALQGGYAVIAQSYPGATSAALVAREREIVAATHAEVGALALERWMLPEPLAAAIAAHHDEDLSTCKPEVRRLAAILQVAGELGRLLCQPAISVGAGDDCRALLARLEIPMTAIPSMLKQIESDVGELAQILRLPIVTTRSFATIAAALTAELAVAA